MNVNIMTLSIAYDHVYTVICLPEHQCKQADSIYLEISSRPVSNNSVCDIDQDSALIDITNSNPTSSEIINHTKDSYHTLLNKVVFLSATLFVHKCHESVYQMLKMLKELNRIV